MSRRVTDWTDAFLGKAAESALPTDDFTPSNGTTFGLDSFSFAEPNGEGIEDAQRLPSTRGLSGLPDGFTRDAEAVEDPELLDEEDGIVLSQEDVGLPKDAAVVDLRWLDPTQPQDPERLPDGEATHDSLAQLEELWQDEEPTDGGILHPVNQDLAAAQYHESLKETEHSRLPGTVDEDAVREAARRAVRRAHFGHPIEKIKEGLVEALGHDAARLKKVVAALEADHGLLGHVFVRASAFPGLKNGEWVKEIRRACRTARYVITDDATVATKLGMQMVSEVPWKEALAHYKPLLAATGYRVASGDPKEALRKAFLAGPRLPKPKESHLPVVKPEVASAEEAAAALKQAAEVEAPKPKTVEEKAVEDKRKAALVKVAKWVQGGFLSREDALRLHASKLDAYAILKAAADLMAVTKNKAVYAGEGTLVSEEARVACQQVWESIEKKQAAVEEALLAKVKTKLLKAVKAGQLTKEEAKRIALMGKTASELDKIIATAIQHAHEKRVAKLKPTQAAEYKGAVQKAATVQAAKTPKVSAEMQRVLQASKNSGVAAQEILGLLRWARQQMSEGQAGRDFDALLAARFASPVLKAAAPLLKEARAKHEGLSGHLYVDAAAYASPAGSTGCERNASKHRTSGVKFVLAMPRCGSCVHRNAENVCSQFNKKLVVQLPVADPAAYQKEMIRLANATDAENTAALFDPREYNLTAGEMDHVDLAEHASPEKLGNVLFGSGPDLEE